MNNYNIIKVSSENIGIHPQVICFINPKHEAYPLKIKWLTERFKEGLTIKLLYVEGEKKPVGFIEYTPGEYAWKAVDSKGYLFIHCIWTYQNKYKNKGYASALVNDCIEDAENSDKLGVAVMVSDGPFMANKSLFLKNGFEIVDNAKPNHQLLCKQINPGLPPKFYNWEEQLKQYQGLHIVYSGQCPWVSRFTEELKSDSIIKKLDIKFTELKTAEEAQNAPSAYSVFNFIKDGKLLADHYISMTRFKNIIKKEKIV